MLFKYHFFSYLIILSFSFRGIVFSQTLYSHDFSNLTGYTTTEGSFCNLSSCGGSSNSWGITSNVGCITGFSASTFYAHDINSCGTNSTETLTLPSISVVGNGELTFSGILGFNDAGINFSGTNTVTFQYNFTSAGGPWTTGATFQTNSYNSMNCSDCNITGNLTNDAANNFEFDMGDNQDGNTLFIQVIVSGFDGSSENFFLDDIEVSHTPPPCTPPVNSPTNLLFGVTNTNSMEIGWTDAVTGTDVIVIAREFGSTQSEPFDGSSYTGNTVFGSGDELGTGNYVLYSGPNAGASPITVTGLSAGTNYIFSIYSFNSTDNCYNLTELSNNNSTQCTPPSTQVSSLSTSAITESSFNVSWTNGDGDATLVVVQASSSFLTDPSNGVTYSANANFGDGDEIGSGNFVVYNGTGTSVSITGLNPGDTYNILIYTYSNTGPCYLDTEANISETTSSIITMVDGDITTCGGTFYDPGGTGNYPNGATITTTIFPENSGDAVCLDFSLWELDYNALGFSTLSFYDGTSAAAPLIMTATGEWVVSGASATFDFDGPGMVCSSSGALTLLWNPDDTEVGWEAEISCYTPVSPVASCNISIEANTNVICPGETAQITAIGSITSVEISNDFNTGTIGTGWSSSVSGDFSNPCGAGSDGTTYFWMGTNAAPRTLSTPAYDVSNGGVISFDHKQAIQGDGDPCEGPDLVEEGVYLQYSTDGGTSWNTIHYFFPYFYTDGSTHLSDWQTYNFDIPTAARTASTSFRFTQQEISSNTTDHWGLDNVSITSFTPVTFSWDNGLGAGATQDVSPTSETTYTVTISDGSSSCTDDVTISMCLVLPVELTNFNAFSFNDKVILDWTTASEINNSHFEIQKSIDGKSWNTFAIMDGAGNSSTVKEYSSVDYSPFPNSTYYRLKQVDFDGQYSYSEVKIVKNTDVGFQIQSTLIKSGDAINLININNSSTINIFDLNGKLIYSKVIARGIDNIEIKQDFPKGFYLIELRSDNGFIKSEKIIIN